MHDSGGCLVGAKTVVSVTKVLVSHWLMFLSSVAKEFGSQWLQWLTLNGKNVFLSGINIISIIEQVFPKILYYSKL